MCWILFGRGNIRAPCAAVNNVVFGSGTTIEGQTGIFQANLAFTNIEKPHEEDRSASRTWLWILGLIASIATAGFTVVLLRHEQQEVIEGFMIESEKE